MLDIFWGDFVVYVTVRVERISVTLFQVSTSYLVTEISRDSPENTERRDGMIVRPLQGEVTVVWTFGERLHHFVGFFLCKREHGDHNVHSF